MDSGEYVVKGILATRKPIELEELKIKIKGKNQK